MINCLKITKNSQFMINLFVCICTFKNIFMIQILVQFSFQNYYDRKVIVKTLKIHMKKTLNCIQLMYDSESESIFRTLSPWTIFLNAFFVVQLLIHTVLYESGL